MLWCCCCYYGASVAVVLLLLLRCWCCRGDGLTDEVDTVLGSSQLLDQTLHILLESQTHTHTHTHTHTQHVLLRSSSETHNKISDLNAMHGKILHTITTHTHTQTNTHTVPHKQTHTPWYLGRTQVTDRFQVLHVVPVLRVDSLQEIHLLL